MHDVIAFIEQNHGGPRRVALEIASEARVLADKLGGKAHAVVLGSGAAQAAELLKKYPLDAIHVSEDPDIDGFLFDPMVDYLEAAAKAVGPSLILIGNTQLGRDLGSRLAARLHCGINADVTDVKIDGSTVGCISPKLGGLTITQCNFKGSDYGIACIRPNVFSAAEAAGAGAISQLEKPAPKHPYTMKIVETIEKEATALGVEEASVVVSGGRGMGGPEPFTTILKDLADAFGGAVGASRAAVDAGWVPHSHQVGQTGKAISPNLYFAIGISGAIQHKVGMRTASTIIAINKDEAATIGEFADLLVAGDLNEIVPELTKQVRAAKSH